MVPIEIKEKGKGIHWCFWQPWIGALMIWDGDVGGDGGILPVYCAISTTYLRSGSLRKRSHPEKLACPLPSHENAGALGRS